MIVTRSTNLNGFYSTRKGAALRQRTRGSRPFKLKSSAKQIFVPQPGKKKLNLKGDLVAHIASGTEIRPVLQGWLTEAKGMQKDTFDAPRHEDFCNALNTYLNDEAYQNAPFFIVTDSQGQVHSLAVLNMDSSSNSRIFTIDGFLAAPHTLLSSTGSDEKYPVRPIMDAVETLASFNRGRLIRWIDTFPSVLQAVQVHDNNYKPVAGNSQSVELRL
ncbi:MAG: hypothetical protein SFU25_01970 [Candidatus Caenarcaniphilales bacterium]|nr:hypothetical protein [Candidatus Caenarcaniphilales bacterium]